MMIRIKIDNDTQKKSFYDGLKVIYIYMMNFLCVNNSKNDNNIYYHDDKNITRKLLMLSPFQCEKKKFCSSYFLFRFISM